MHRWILALFVLGIGWFSLPALSEEAENLTLFLTDGTELKGSISSFTDDDAIIVTHESGVRRLPLTEVEEPLRSQLRQEHAEKLAESAREAAEVAGAAADILVEEMSGALAEELEEKLEPRGDEWILVLGIIVTALGLILMFIFSFAESPVWGLCFFLTGGLSWLPFFFLCFKKAWFPTVVSTAGIAAIVFFVVQRAA